MKTFKDLEFKIHPNPFVIGHQAVMLFENGYGVSVVRFEMLMGGGYGSYTSNESEWELAVIKKNGEGWSLTYETPITDDVIGYLTKEGVTRVMKQVQEL